MQLALSGTELESEEPIDQLLLCATELRISFVELWYPKNTEAEGLEQTLARLSDVGIQVACVSTSSELFRGGGSYQDQLLLLEAIHLAEQFRAPFVNTYFGQHSVYDDVQAIATYADYLEPCLEQAQLRGVTIVLENEFDAFEVDPLGSDISRRPLSLLHLFERVDSPHFRLNFDACNFYCAGVEPYPYSYELLAPYIAYCHVKDVSRSDQAPCVVDPMHAWRRYKDHKNEFVMTPLGDGEIPWSALLRRLHSDGYHGFLTLEPHAAKLQLARAWEQAAGYVRHLL